MKAPSTRTRARSSSTSSTRRTRSSRRTGRRSPTSSPTAREMPEAIRRTCGTPGPVHAPRPTMYRAYHVTEPDALLQRQRDSGWCRPTRARAGVERPAVEATADRRQTVGRRRNQPQAASSTGARIEPLLPAHPAPRREDRGLPHPAAVRAGVEGQQPDAARVVHDGRVRSRASTASSSVHDADGPTVAGPVQVDSTINRTPAISHRVHAAEPAGLAGRPGQHAAHPGRATRSLYIRPFYVRGRATGSYPPFRSSSSTTPARRVLGTDASQDALDQCSGSSARRPRAPLAGATAAPATDRRPPTTATTTVDHAARQASDRDRTPRRPRSSPRRPAEYQQDLLNQVGDMLDQAQPRSSDAEPSATTTSSSTTTTPARR